jgi:hypothetical protein
VVFAQEAAAPASPARDLSSGFPTSVIDTVTAPASKFVFGAAGSYITDGGTYEAGLVALTYGITDTVQAFADWPLILGEGHVTGNFDTVLGLTWAALKEEGSMPALGLEVAAKFPTGYGFTGYDGTLTGIATKSFGEVRGILNASYTTIGKAGDGGKHHTDAFALGVDYMVVDNVDLIVDVVSMMAPVSGADRIDLAQVGVRAALTDVDILSVGVSAGIGNGNATPDFIGTVGYQRSF